MCLNGSRLFARHLSLLLEPVAKAGTASDSLPVHFINRNRPVGQISTDLVRELQEMEAIVKVEN